jgi:hypothetical protein
MPSVNPPFPRVIASKRARRAFVGLAGSPLAQVTTEEPIPKPQPLSNAERQRLFRERQGDAARKKDADRKAAERADEREKQRDEAVWVRGKIPIRKGKPAARVRAPHPETLMELNGKLAKSGLSVNEGVFIKNAPHGKGKLVSGGYDNNKFDEVIAAKIADCDGRVRPTGHEPEPSIDRNEHDRTLAPDSSIDPNFWFTCFVHGRWQWDMDAREQRSNKAFLEQLTVGTIEHRQPVTPDNLPKPEDQGWLRGPDGKWSKSVTDRKNGAVERAE